MKTCTRCKQSKETDQFPLQSRAKDGRNPWCRECHRAYRQLSPTVRAHESERKKRALCDRHEKICTQCGVLKDLSGYAPDKRATDGRVSECRECSRIRRRARYAANPEKELAKNREWVEKNKARVREYQQEWSVANRDKKRAAAKRYQERNPEKRREYYEEHKEQILAVNREWAENNKERARAKQLEWRRAHPERRRAIEARYRKTHPSYDVEKEARRRAHIANAAVVEDIKTEVVVLRDGMFCHLCEKPVLKHELSLDHLIPISRGGDHSYANIGIAHRICNSAKGNKLIPSGAFRDGIY